MSSSVDALAQLQADSGLVSNVVAARQQGRVEWIHDPGTTAIVDDSKRH
jgi:hypothetical protein